jgi:rubrerythrin
MPITFNADEIFEMAIEIEKQGQKFYTSAADITADPDTKQFMKNMAGMELSHAKTFEIMRQDLTDQEKASDIFDPANEAALYLQAMADSHGQEGLKTPDIKFDGSESPQQIIEAAIAAEKNSVVFYTGIKEMVPRKAGRGQIDAIIKEEMGHIAALTKKLAEL